MFKKIPKAYLIAGAILVLIIGISAVLFFTDPPKRRHPVSVHNISQISGWMTFEYINMLFDVPQELLQEKLGIQNSKYPLVTLKQYAKKSNKDVDSVVKEVQESIQTYLDHKPEGQ